MPNASVTVLDPPQAPTPYAFNKSDRLDKLQGSHATLFLCHDTGAFGEPKTSKEPSHRGIAILIIRSNNKKTVRLFVNNTEIKEGGFKLLDDYLVFYQAPFFGRVEISGDGNRAFGSFQDTNNTYRSISGYAAPLSCIESISDGKVMYNFSTRPGRLATKPPQHPGANAPAPLTSSFTLMDSKSTGSGNSNLSVANIMSMNPFKKDKDGNYHDVVQDQCNELFYKIVVYYIWKNNSDMYKMVYGNDTKPSFYKDISTYINNPLNSNQENFCNSLAVPYLVTVIGPNSTYRKRSDYAKEVNYNRAATFLKSETSKSKTFQSMMQQLYLAQFIKSNPDIQDYINDQQNPPNVTPSYPTQVQTDAASWSSTASTAYPTDSTISQAPLTDLQTIIDQASALGQNKNFWSYSLFRYVSSPEFLTDSFLNKMIATTNSSQEIDLQIKHTVGLLNVLDSTQQFSHWWLQVVQGYSMVTMFMNLSDYASLYDYISDPDSGLKALLQQTATCYAGSSDPNMAEISQIISANLGDEDSSDLNMFFEALVASFAGIQGLTGFDALEVQLRAQLPNIYQTHGVVSADQVAAANKFMDAAIVGTAVLSIAMLAAGGSQLWNEMAPTDRASVIAGLTMGAGVLLKYVIDVGGPAVWPLLPQRVATLFTLAARLYQFEWTNINEAIVRLSANVMNQLQGVRIVRPNGIIVSEVAPGHGILTKIFGKNFSQLLTRIGGILAVLGIVVSAIGIANSETPTDIAINVAFLLASTAELVSVAASWAVAEISGVIGAMGCAVIAGIATFASVFAIGAALLGIAILIVMFFVSLFSSSDPIEDFVKKYATPAGYYMRFKTDFDFVQPVAHTDGTYGFAGINIQMKKASATSLYVDIDAENNTSISVAKQDYTWHTTFSWLIDQNGRVLISAIVPLSNGEFSNKLLTAHTDGSVSWDDPIFRNSHSGPIVADNSKQLWYPILQSVGSKADKSKYQDNFRVLESCVVNLQSQYFNQNGNTPMYLCLNNNQVTLSPTGQDTEILLTPSAPSGYVQPNIRMFVGYQSHVYIPAVAMKGTDPRSYKIQGLNGAQLPSFLSFDTTTGIITQTAQVKTTDVTSSPLSFSVTVSNKYGSAAPCTFTLTVSPIPE